MTTETARKTSVSYDEALQALRDAVALKGEDYVYPDSEKVGSTASCVYFNADGTPSCIVGHVMAGWGYTLADLHLAPTGDAYRDLNQAGASARYFKTIGIQIEEDASSLLGFAQDKQDVGRTWGNAVTTAVTAVPKSVSA